MTAPLSGKGLLQSVWSRHSVRSIPRPDSRRQQTSMITGGTEITQSAIVIFSGVRCCASLATRSVMNGSGATISLALIELSGGG